MKIYGLQKTTLLDFPGYVAAAIFLGGCNFKCPYCHNAELISPSEQGLISEDELFKFLEKRASILEGICITGGEPTIQADLDVFIRRIRELGFLIKLDTNGYYPDTLMNLCNSGLIDYVAMDIKTCKLKYPKVTDVEMMQIAPIEKSVAYLKTNKIPYEFRTTVVKELHEMQDFTEIGQWLEGCSAYYIQNFKDSDQVLYKGFHGFCLNELYSIKSVLDSHITNVLLRGIDE